MSDLKTAAFSDSESEVVFPPSTTPSLRETLGVPKVEAAKIRGPRVVQMPKRSPVTKQELEVAKWLAIPGRLKQVEVSMKVTWRNLGMDFNHVCRKVFGNTHPQSWWKQVERELLEQDRLSESGERALRIALEGIPPDKWMLTPLVADTTMKVWSVYRVAGMGNVV